MFSVDHLNDLRMLELESVLPHLPERGRVLEIGAGTGRQALALSERGLEVSAIDIPSSDYSGHRLFPVQDYDGTTIPFEDGAFDVVYSSNTLEHVRDLTRMHAEIARVLKPDGKSIHILPSHWWRIWTTLTGPLGAVQTTLAGHPVQGSKILGGTVLLVPHGERGNAISELRLFQPSWWTRNFEQNGFTVVEREPVELFYTGCMVMGKRLSFARRRALSRILGSASYLYVARKAGKSG
ncbi:MAG TPA: class I SAM-dependent methyltransferase [Allosphingosinicella sp.]|nr:class I SAM-dependent methyltransferase [Allosphingosinicella sp.]